MSFLLLANASAVVNSDLKAMPTDAEPLTITSKHPPMSADGSFQFYVSDIPDAQANDTAARKHNGERKKLNGQRLQKNNAPVKTQQKEDASKSTRNLRGPKAASTSE